MGYTSYLFYRSLPKLGLDITLQVTTGDPSGSSVLSWVASSSGEDTTGLVDNEGLISSSKGRIHNT